MQSDAMQTRYQQLRGAVLHLASPAAEQAAYLDRLMAPLTKGGSAAASGNDELALEFEDIFGAAADMISHGELTEDEAAAIRPLDDLLDRLSGGLDAGFWRRDALFDDERWNEVRSVAGKALTSLPDEIRAVGRSAIN